VFYFIGYCIGSILLILSLSWFLNGFIVGLKGKEWNTKRHRESVVICVTIGVVVFTLLINRVTGYMLCYVVAGLIVLLLWPKESKKLNAGDWK